MGGETEEAGGEGDDLGAREEEVEVGGEEEERALGVAGDEAAGRTGVRREKWVAEDGMVGGTTPPITVGLVLGAAAAAGELGAFVLAAVAAQATGGLDVTVAVVTALEFADGTARGFAAAVVEVVHVAAFVVAAVVSASGGVEDLGLLPSEGDGVLISSIGLFCTRREEIVVFECALHEQLISDQQMLLWILHRSGSSQTSLILSLSSDKNGCLVNMVYGVSVSIQCRQLRYLDKHKYRCDQQTHRLDSLRSFLLYSLLPPSITLYGRLRLRCKTYLAVTKKT